MLPGSSALQFKTNKLIRICSLNRALYIHLYVDLYRVLDGSLLLHNIYCEVRC